MPISYHRGTTGFSLYRNHTEIFICCKNKSLGMLHLLFQHIKRLIAHHCNIFIGQFFIILQIWSSSNYDQFLIGHPIEGFNDDVYLLICYKSATRQIVVLFITAIFKVRNINIRVNRHRVPAISFFDAPSHIIWITDKIVHTKAGKHIPLPDIV